MDRFIPDIIRLGASHHTRAPFYNSPLPQPCHNMNDLHLHKNQLYNTIQPKKTSDISPVAKREAEGTGKGGVRKMIKLENE
jgi:hypothetical protein